MKKYLKIFMIIAFILVFLGCTLFASYKIFFAPKVSVTATSESIKINEKNLFSKFIPNDINLSFTEVSASSNATFSSKELTDLGILIIQDSPNLKETIKGLKISMENNQVIVYATLDFLNLPCQATLKFNCISENGKGILHFSSGNLGPIPISKNMIFENLTDNSLIQIDKNEGNIILSFPSIKLLQVTNFYVNGDKLDISFKGTIKFWDWLKN